MVFIVPIISAVLFCFSDPKDVRDFIYAAYGMDMRNPEYLFIQFTYKIDLPELTPWIHYPGEVVSAEEMAMRKEAFLAMKIVRTHIITNKIEFR